MRSKNGLHVLKPVNQDNHVSYNMRSTTDAASATPHDVLKLSLGLLELLHNFSRKVIAFGWGGVNIFYILYDVSVNQQIVA